MAATSLAQQIYITFRKSVSFSEMNKYNICNEEITCMFDEAEESPQTARQGKKTRIFHDSRSVENPASLFCEFNIHD